MKRVKFLATFVFLAAPLFAEESTAGAAAEKPGVLIWQAANFLILVAVLYWLSKKYGGPLLAARSKGIREGLAAGEKAKSEADARAAQVKSKIANLDKEIAALRTAAKDERDRESERIRRDTQTEIARIHLQADHEVEASGKQARLEVQRVAARIAIELAEHQVRARMSPQVQDSLLKGFLSDLLRDGAFRTASNSD